MTVLPLIGLGFILSESAELAMIVGAVGIAVGSLTWNYRHHRKWRVFLKLRWSVNPNLHRTIWNFRGCRNHLVWLGVDFCLQSFTSSIVTFAVPVNSAERRTTDHGLLCHS